MLLAVGQVPVYAQDATLRGFVKDGSNGQLLDLVNVLLVHVDGTTRGVASRDDGLYQFRGIRPGQYELRASFIGFSAFVQSITLSAGELRTLNISLQPADAELGEVLVEGRIDASVEAPVAGLQTVRAAEIDRIPSPDVSGDLASYLTALPGVVSTGDQGGQLFIRGGEPAQNMVLLDGILIYQPFHLLGFYSAFPSDIISKADIYAGGFGSKYAGRLSSVIDIQTRNGNTRRFAGSGAVSPFIGSLQLEGPVIPGRASFTISARQSLLEEVASQVVDDALPYAFGDFFGKFYAEVNATSKLTVTYLKTRDRGTLGDDTGGIDPEEIRWGNEAIGLRYLFLPRNVGAVIEFRVSHSRLDSEFGSSGNPSRTSEIENTHVILEATFIGDHMDVHAGFDLRPTVLSSRLDGVYQNVDFRVSRIGNWGNYLEFAIKLGPSLRIIPSVRAQFYRVRFNPYLEPRLRVQFNRGKHEINAAGGIYHQEILGLQDRRDAANIFTAWTNVPRRDGEQESVLTGRIQQAIHGILGYNLELGTRSTFSIEGYYRRLSNLFIAEWTAFPRFTTRLQPASGRSAGFDMRWRYQGESFRTQLNYTFSNTKYLAEQASIPVWYGNETLEFRPPHDRRHQVNLSVGATLLAFDLEAQWVFGAGLPFSRAIGFDGFAVIDDIEDVGRVPTSRRVIYERPFSGLLPAYHRLDLSVGRKFELGGASVTMQGSIINAYNRSNIFYLDIFTLRRVDQLPVIPSLGIKVGF